MMPNAYRSLRASPRFPLTCSGEMYSAVPITCESLVNVSRRDPDLAAMPKSMSLTRSSSPPRSRPGGDAKVDELDAIVIVDHDVVGLQIAVHDSMLVNVLQHFAD